MHVIEVRSSAGLDAIKSKTIHLRGNFLRGAVAFPPSARARAAPPTKAPLLCSADKVHKNWPQPREGQQSTRRGAVSAWKSCIMCLACEPARATKKSGRHFATWPSSYTPISARMMERLSRGSHRLRDFETRSAETGVSSGRFDEALKTSRPSNYDAERVRLDGGRRVVLERNDCGRSFESRSFARLIRQQHCRAARAGTRAGPVVICSGNDERCFVASAPYRGS